MSTIPELAPFIDLATRPDVVEQFGVEPGWRFAMVRHARFADLDALAHLNHTTYLRYFEDARLQYLVHHGLEGLRRGGKDTPSPVLLGLEIRYLKPAFHGDAVLATVRTAKIGNTSMSLDYAAWTTGCAATCTSPFVLMNAGTGEKVTVPDDMRKSISDFEPDGLNGSPTAG